MYDDRTVNVCSGKECENVVEVIFDKRVGLS
jgi:hypothetical protein